MTGNADHDALYIGGAYVAPRGKGWLEVVSPATEQVIGRAPAASVEDVDAAVAAARAAFDDGPWPRMPVAERAEVMLRVAQGIGKRREAIAQLITAEMGAPIAFSRVAQVSTALLEQYAAMADGLFAPEQRRQGAFGGLVVRREPVGVAGLIIPWNAPLGLLLGKLAPALLVGCTTVVKAAPQTPLDSYFLAEACDEAGLPPGVVNIVAADREVSERVVTHPGVDKISFTGSTAAGRRIMSLCGDQVKRVTLELGGKSANIICEDADLAAAIPLSLQGGMLNNGEACIALTRVLAPRSRYDEVVEALAAGAAMLPVGDPFDESTVIGPLVTEVARARVEGYIAAGRAAGARVVSGGGRPAALPTGWYVEPTVLADVDNSMTVAREEIFGPVLCVIPYDGVAEAVAIANDSPYGLCGAVWTSDVEKGVDIARSVRTGTFNVNGFSYDTTAPFGGFKQSGIGREWGAEGLDAYTESKTIMLPRPPVGEQGK
ncbi:Geranial dehydrogenase [Frankia canadensis]|uniref:Geranial dehydrogenase n=1 Tax=Frankia canadensis TaxID=1836972 RepID=A0A2I2KI34_9ACTN|nr:aldehyde dehydrogenase [Frankia canadensis]SNQ45326.1 Geranial dehydrogenase [Frankia canadensis]SOU52616.1 Geranial dehydrogenase [Frankia canadensis]